MWFKKISTTGLVVAILILAHTGISIADAAKCRKPFDLMLGERVSMRFCKIPAPRQSVLMGSESGDENERPLGVRTFTSFQIGQFEVTQAQYYEVTKESPWNSSDANFSDINVGEKFPATNMSYDDTKKFFKALNEIDKCAEYRLPTPSEWEYAARGKAAQTKRDLQHRYWEPEPASEFAFYLQESSDNLLEPEPPSEVQACPNGKKNSTQPGYCANNFGLYHMLGNVWELTSAISHKGLVPLNGQLDGNLVYNVDPIDFKSFDRNKKTYVEVRGGGADVDLIFVRASTRAAMSTEDHTKYVGFRVARIPKLGVECSPNSFKDKKVESETFDEEIKTETPKYDHTF